MNEKEAARKVRQQAAWTALGALLAVTAVIVLHRAGMYGLAVGVLSTVQVSLCALTYGLGIFRGMQVG